MKIIHLTLLCVMAITAVAQSKSNYEIYAIRYATIPDFPVYDLVAGAEPGRKLDIAMMIWLVRGNGRNILVDSGFYHDRFFKDWQVKDFTKPSDTLQPARPEARGHHRHHHHAHALGSRRRHGSVS